VQYEPTNCDVDLCGVDVRGAEWRMDSGGRADGRDCGNRDEGIDMGKLREFAERLETITDCQIYGGVMTPATVVFDFGTTVSPAWLRQFALGKVGRKRGRTYLEIRRER
jgi:hypothetical protein